MRHNCIIAQEVRGYRTVFTGVPGRWFSPLDAEATHMSRGAAKRMVAYLAAVRDRDTLAIEEVH